ncbi:hypothetical protein EL22_03355 [Halostagnicola sp. A56]|uniref:DUF6432 family protein n=1 Tax=Halostagnicola sp. A56 TaxID=1495067 RepID=UPI0004A0D859|nr:DUF6432 family protein [Halostagnicola sp. A56]KDE58675.1 hypothetical protein EL22_03355 [Halostagnicola sp. A56]
MKAKSEYRDRERTQVAVLDELVNNLEDGMTVFELRAAVSVEIDELEDALATLKDDGLIDVDRTGGRAVIKPDDRVVPDVSEDEKAEEESLGEWIRDRLPF